MIDKSHDLSLTSQAQLVSISRGSVYYLPKATISADLAIMRSVDELNLEHPFMGVRMLRRHMQPEGVAIGRLHISTLMRRMGIQTLCPQPGTSKATPGQKIYPYLLRHLRSESSNQVWALDTTYIAMDKGFVYLTAVVDVATHEKQVSITVT